MIRLDMEQGSPAWTRARLGIPTASQFDRIVTPKTLQVSASSAQYRNELLAEFFLGAPIEHAGTGFMDRGVELERDAFAWYEMHRDVDVDRVGFCLLEDGTAGCSPDGLVGEDGGLELKCPSAAVHIKYLLDPALLYDAYKSQVQGELWVTGRAWWDIASYHPTLPPVLTRHQRDETYCAALDKAIPEFSYQLEVAKTLLRERYGMEAPVVDGGLTIEQAVMS